MGIEDISVACEWLPLAQQVQLPGTLLCGCLLSAPCTP